MQQPSIPPAGAVQRPLGVTILVILAAFRGVVGLWASIAVVGVLNSLGAGDFAILNLIWLAIAAVFGLGLWRVEPQDMGMDPRGWVDCRFDPSRGLWNAH